MPSVNSSLSTPHPHTNSINAFITTYISASNAEKDSLFAAQKNTFAMAIKTPHQFGRLISCLDYRHMSELYHTITIANSFFIKNAAEFAQVCIYLDFDRIQMFCSLMAYRLNIRNFIDNAGEFCTIFSSFPSEDGKTNISLNTSQLQIIYDTLKPKLNTPSFFHSLNDFIKLFCAISEPQDKIEVFQIVENQLDQLIKSENDINSIHQNLKSTNTNEFELFKQVREKIYRLFIKDRTRLDKAFHAMLLLILDNYPGNQPDRLKSIIDSVFLDQSTTELNTLLEKAESAMRFIEFNITSTRLKNAIGYLIENLRGKEKIIEVDYIIQLAKSKMPIMSLFPEKLVESEVKQTITFQPQF